MDGNIRGYWECSRILLGQANPGMDHDGPYPFAFWSVISEVQKARSGGCTTRPGGIIDEERFEDVDGPRKFPDYPDEVLANPIAGRKGA